MQHLGEKWLRIANIGYSLYSVVFLVVFVILENQNKIYLISNQRPGVEIFSVTIAVVTLFYTSTIYRLVKKYSVWMSYTIGFAIFAILISVAFESSVSTPAEHYMLVQVALLNVLAVLYGAVVGLSIVGISGIVLGMTLAGNAGSTSLGVKADILIFFLRSSITMILLFILRKKYVSDTAKDQSYVARYFVNNEVVKLLTNSIGDGVIIIDQNEVIKTINPAAIEILGQEAKDVLELNYRSVLKFKNINGSNLSPDKEPVTLAIKDRKSIRQELVLPKKDKSIYVDVTVSVIITEDKNNMYGAIITLRDISTKKKEEAARSEFISTASHEMRTPVAAIEGYLALALNPNVSRVDEKTKSFLQKAYTSTQHLGQLFQDLLVSTRAEDGRIASHPQVIELGEILKRQAEYFAIVAQKKGLKLEFLVSTLNKHSTMGAIKPLYYTYADPARIQEVTTNLIDNAIKYTNSGKITVGLTGDRSVVQIFIKDTGVGLDQEDIPHLFQKFYRVDNSATRTTGGTGLGLFICRKIVELYKGQIWVQSQKDKGSTFFINLPRLDSTQANARIMHDATRSNRQA